MNLQDLPDMSDALKKVQQFDEKKKLDPVGKEDGDVDNDGDKDSSDEYLMKRRKAIAKAMKKEAYVVTNADKKGNTPAYQNYKKGMKGKDGKPLYKAADHMKESGMSEEEIENIERISQEFDAAVEEGTAYGLYKGDGKDKIRAPRMQKGAMAYDGPNKAASEAKDRVLAKAKAKRESK